MKSYYHHLYKLLLCLLPFVVSCKHEQLEIYTEHVSYRPGGDFIKNNYDLSMFAAAIEKAGLMEELNGPGPFTILAPSNQAFYELGLQRPSDFDRLNKDSLRFMMQYHVLNRRLNTRDIPVKGVDVRYATLADGKEIYVSNETNGPLYNRYHFNGSLSTPADVTITNGTLHVLNKVMKYEKGTVRDWLEKRKDYSIITAAFKKFGFWKLLAEDGPFTVFAPDNAAFEKSGIDIAAIEKMDTSAFYGNRLFGVYIQRVRNYFISDFIVFKTNNNEYSLSDYIYGDNYYLTMQAEEAWPKKDLLFSVMVRTAKDYPYEVLPKADGCELARRDNLTDNGIVQPMVTLAVQPKDATK
ncbi:fasciclin domain-containing protein [Chitinophaga defluvii]|uniref:Fasciclin domain-containing protein n=1 Tax=Chitinophaga defluvii TaxID=3163343 RepID=A0ABV2T4D7_9BACT